MPLNELMTENKNLKRKVKVLEQTLNQFNTIKTNYDGLIRKLEEKEENLKEINLKLEDLVKERTKELENINDKLQENLVLLEELSITDALTGIRNRRSFDEIFTRELNRSIRQQYEFNFLIIDVDQFKKYNDTYGHRKGDDVLKCIGDILNNLSQRATDHVFRFGGEEFVYMSCFLNKEKTLSLCEKILSRIREKNIPHVNNENFGRVTASIGAVIVLGNKEEKIIDNEKIFEAADHNLYEAKKTGRNKIILKEI